MRDRSDHKSPERRVKEKRDLERIIRDDAPAALVVNTRSRQGGRLYARARDLLLERGIRLGAAYPVRDPVRFPEVVQEVIARGYKLVIVGGGDGTISSVVDDFAYKDVALGILPLGTANSFARTLGLPLSIEKATEVLASGKVADVDLGKVNADYFANTAALGLSAGVARSMPHLLKRYLGKAGYLLVGAKRFLAHRPFRFRLVQDDRVVGLLALDVLIANGRYHGGVLVAPDAGVETRDLVVQVVKGETKWNLAKAWIHLGLLSFETLPYVAVIRTKDAVIDTTPEQYVSIDGEAVTQTPVRISVAYEALRLIVPQEFENNDDIECD